VFLYSWKISGLKTEAVWYFVTSVSEIKSASVLTED
jgi:hypothetical protein